MNNGTLHTETKDLGSTAEWSEATVRTGEATASRFSSSYGSSVNEATIARAKAWVYICANANATACAGQTMRLYRKAGKSRKAKRITERTRAKYLHSPAVGGKAMMYAEQAGDVEEIIDHPAITLLRNPSEWYRGTDFFRLLFMWRELCGNSFVGLVGATNGEPESMLPLMPQHVRIQPSLEMLVGGYWYGRAAERVTFLEPDEVIHHKFAPSPFDPYNGIGPLYAVLAEADLDAATTADETARWLNGARPDFVAKLPKGTPLAEREAFKANINSQHRGPNNAGKFLVVTEAEIEPLSWSMKEMEYVASRENVRERIMASFDIPESRFKMNDANRASSLTGDVQYMRDGIRPRLIQDAENWTEALLPKFGIEPGEMWFAYDNCVPGDDSALATTNAALVTAGIRTVNEARNELGDDASDDPSADVLRSPQTTPAPYQDGGDKPDQDQTPADAAKNPLADVQATALNGAQVTALIDLLAQAADQKIPIESLEPIIEAAFPLLDPSLVSRIVQPLYGFEPKSEEPKPIDPNTPPSEAVVKAIEAAVRKAIEPGEVPDDDAIKEIMRRAAVFFTIINPQLADQVGRGVEPAEALRAVDFQINLIERIGPAIEQRFEEGFGFGQEEAEEFIEKLDEATRGSITPSFDLASPDAQRFLNQHTIRLARSVSATTEATLRGAIAEGLESGDGIPELTQRVGEVLEDRTPMESERIARTEASRAYNRGREAAWQSSGVVDGKEWLLSGNPCPICVELAAKFNAENAVPLDTPFVPLGGTIDLPDGAKFTADYEAVYGPPVHPNCSCAIGARFNV